MEVPVPVTEEVNKDCLLAVMKSGGVDPEGESLRGALDHHLLFAEDMAFACIQCPVISTAEIVGQTAIISLLKESDCIAE